mgnify:CR=1 FL=1
MYMCLSIVIIVDIDNLNVYGARTYINFMPYVESSSH